MEVLIAVVALVLGLLIGFVLLRNRKSGVVDVTQWEQRLAERDAVHARELEQKLEAQQQVYKVQAQEKARAAAREAELMQESFARQLELAQKEKQAAIEALEARQADSDKAHGRLMAEQQSTYRESLEQRDKNHAETVKRLESAHKQELDIVQQAHRQEIETINANNRHVLEELNRRHNEALEALRSKFTETVNTMSEQLKTATSDMLKQRQQEFSESSRERIGQILDPLQHTISEMRKAVDNNTTRSSELGGQLDAGLKTLLTHTQQAQASAEKLASALKGNNKIQGVWGEAILKELLEGQGLVEGRHFETQASFADTDDTDNVRLRPDVILHLDKGRELIIDSKVSLSAYMEYLEAETDEARDRALNAHIRSLQNHVKELSRKDYSRYIKAPKTRIDYVIMFVPVTSALLLATSNKPDLWRRAMEDNVYIADEQTLYAALRIIEMTWTQIAQAQNQEKVFDLAGQMIERVEQFLKSYQEVGEKLDAARKSFEAGKKKLEQRGHSIPYTGKKLLDLGARTSKPVKSLNDFLGLDEGEGETE